MPVINLGTMSVGVTIGTRTCTCTSAPAPAIAAATRGGSALDPWGQLGKARLLLCGLLGGAVAPPASMA